MLLSVIIIAGAIALALFLIMYMATGIALLDVPEDSWIMTTFSPDGQDDIRVQNQGFYLSINSTKIIGRICNGFAGDIQYLNSSAVIGEQVAFTLMLCGGQHGPLKMQVESAFQEGLLKGMTIHEREDTLTLQDIRTNATFTFVKHP